MNVRISRFPCRTLLILLTAVFLVAPWWAVSGAGFPSADEAVKMKEQGDQYAREGNFTKAADAYAGALSSAAVFPDDERLDMARVLAWGGKLDRSRRELVLLLDKHPGNIKARVQLGRVLFWMGEIESAQAEAERAAGHTPDDPDALLLAADIARVKGDYEKAMALYQSILKTGEQFDARNGLAYTYLAAGNVTEARRNFERLSPVFPYQRQEVEKLKGAIADADKPRVIPSETLARKSWEQGNQLTESGQYNAAAQEYLNALSLSQAFTADEQFRMAQVMSWAGTLPEARQRLTKILAENPAMIPVRIHLARVLLWSGELDAALREIDQVLLVESANREALLVRAGALRMKRNYRPSVALYSELLEKQEDYDAREGLTYARLLSGDRVAADASLPLLKPAFPYEEKALTELKELRDIAFNPSVAPGVSYYSDSDKNEVWRFFATGTVWFYNWKTNLDYIHTNATDQIAGSSTDSIVLSTYSRMPFYGGIGGSIGIVDAGTNVSWSIRGDVDIPDGSIGAKLAVDTLSDTSAVIQNHIQVTTASLSAVYRLTDRITFRGGYSYRDYSDENNAHDVTGGASFLVLRKPAAVTAGYRIRSMNYRRQSGHGYFDPNNYLSNVLFINASFERGRFYGYAEPYGGYESFRRNDEGNYNVVIGGAGSIGYRFSKHLAIEADAEGGNSAVGATGAYNYYQVGLKLMATF